MLDTLFRDLAVDLTSKFGPTATLIRDASSVDNVANERTTISQSNLSVRCSIPVSPKENEVDDEQILGTDLFLLIPARDLSTFDPPDQDKDTVSLGGNVYKVVSVVPLYSGDLIAAYRLQLRR